MRARQSRYATRCCRFIQQAVAASADGEARVKALTLGIEAIFGVELPQESRFVTAVTRAY